MTGDNQILGYICGGAAFFACPACKAVHDAEHKDDPDYAPPCPVYGINLGIYHQTCHDCGTIIRYSPNTCELFDDKRKPVDDNLQLGDFGYQDLPKYPGRKSVVGHSWKPMSKPYAAWDKCEACGLEEYHDEHDPNSTCEVREANLHVNPDTNRY